MIIKKKKPIPSTTNKPFYVTFSSKIYKKNEIILYAPYSTPLRILRIYEDNWFKRLLRKIGFNPRVNQLKVIYVKR